jgi:hypothetical protein
MDHGSGTREPEGRSGVMRRSRNPSVCKRRIRRLRRFSDEDDIHDIAIGGSQDEDALLGK